MALNSRTIRDITGGFNAPIRGLGTGTQASGAAAMPTRSKFTDLIGEGGQPLRMFFGKQLLAGQQDDHRKIRIH